MAGQYSEFCSWEDSSSWGQNLACQSPNIAFGICGSGKNQDCTGASGKVSTQLYCCSEPTVGNPSSEKLYATNNWGQRLACPSGQVVVDYCGSGKNKDCANDNTNSITCATVDSISLQTNTATWYSTNDWGKQLVCPNAMVLTGLCGSGQNKDCPNSMTNEIQCTTYTINN
jgi:hypothetical protein